MNQLVNTIILPYYFFQSPLDSLERAEGRKSNVSSEVLLPEVPTSQTDAQTNREQPLYPQTSVWVCSRLAKRTYIIKDVSQKDERLFNSTIISTMT